MAETHYAKVVWSGGTFGPTESVANYSREFRAEFDMARVTLPFMATPRSIIPC
jgi:hypothetical protein